MENYKSKIVTAEAAVAAAVKDGDWVDYGFGGGFPELLDKALAARKGHLRDVKIRGGLVIRPRIEVVEADPEQEPGSAYLADEVMFMLPAARAAEETRESIAADFSGWWKYGEAWDGQEKAPTVEERLAVMEDFMVAIMEG